MIEEPNRLFLDPVLRLVSRAIKNRRKAIVLRLLGGHHNARIAPPVRVFGLEQHLAALDPTVTFAGRASESNAAVWLVDTVFICFGSQTGLPGIDAALND
jgi:hypothetical protein